MAHRSNTKQRNAKLRRAKARRIFALSTKLAAADGRTLTPPTPAQYVGVLTHLKSKE